MKAYSAVFDNVGGRAKRAARYPAKNFKDVIPVEVKKETFDCLILQAGSVDITNLDTKERPEENLEYFKQEVRYAAKNLFTAAEAAFKAQPSLEKVVIMNQTPRYDDKEVDPLSLKQALALLFNNTLSELWLDSPLKDKLVIGTHNLECVGGIKEARYRDTRKRMYDGVHMYGPSGMKAYTISVLDILKAAKILDQTDRQTHSGQEYYRNLSKFQFQKRKNVRRGYQPAEQKRAKCDSDNDRDIRPKKYNRVQDDYEQRYNVTTSNKFNHLNW